MSHESPPTDGSRLSFVMQPGLFLQFYGLSVMAVGWPVLSRLCRREEFLRSAGISSVAVIICSAALLILLPLAAWFSVRLFRNRNQETAERVAAVTVGIFGSLLTQVLLISVWALPALRRWAIPDLLTIPLSIVAGFFSAAVFRRSPALRQFLTLTGILSCAAPFAFACSGGMPGFLFGHGRTETADDDSQAKFRTPVPVVMIIFDALNGMAITDGTGEIDAQRYPGFAELSEVSTWYRNTSTMHYRTSVVLPALLTGEAPKPELQPTLTDYPSNLLRTMTESGQFRTAVFEPFTMLAPSDAGRTAPPIQAQVGDLASTLLRVYLRTTLPDDLPFTDRLIPREWFGFVDDNTVMRENTLTEGVFRYPWDTLRTAQAEHFRRCITTDPGDDRRPGFFFLHIAVPHYPFVYLPDGRRHAIDSYVDDFLPGTHGELNEDWGADPLAVQQSWQLYLMQCAYADLQLRRILGDLSESGLLEKCLLIVTSDHGTSFVPGSNRREPSDRTIADIAPVALFVHRPGQQTGAVSDENVELSDILPTIYDVLGGDRPASWEGRVLGGSEQPRLRKTLMMPNNSALVIEPDFPERFSYAERMTELFGTGTEAQTDTRYRSFVDADLCGQSAADHVVTTPSPLELKENHVHERMTGSPAEFCPAVIYGEIENIGDRQPVRVAVAVNGVIRSTTRTLEDPEYRRNFTAVIDPRWLEGDSRTLSFYELRGTGANRTLHLIERLLPD